MRETSTDTERRDGALYLLNTPATFHIAPNTAVTTDIVWVSAISDNINGFYQTHIFPAALNDDNPAGFDVLSWIELAGSLDGVYDIEGAMDAFIEALEERDGRTGFYDIFR